MNGHDPRVAAAGPLLLGAYTVGWMAALVLLGVVTTVMLLVNVLVTSGGDPGAVVAWAEAAGRGEAGALPGWLLAASLALQTPAMGLLVPLSWGVADRLLFRPRTGASGRVEGWRGVFALRAVPPRFLALGLVVGFTVGLVPGWFAHAISTGFPDLRNGTLGMINGALREGALVWRLILALEIAVLVPFVEELVFRGFMWDALRRWVSLPTTWLISSAIFCVYHMDPLQSVAIVPTALMLGWLRWSSGSLWPAVVLHMANNALGVSATILAEGEVEPPFVIALGGAIATLGCAALALRWRRARDPHFGDRPLG